MTTSTTSLLPSSASAAEAREFVAATLASWHAEALIPTAMLLTSELVTNAYLHARTGIELRLLRTADGVRFEVLDNGPNGIAPLDADDLDTHGRGLCLVRELAESWGISPGSPLGKTVWFELGSGAPDPAAPPLT